MAVLVSKSDHCLYDLLIRHQSGELPCEVPIIISNHADLEPVAKQFGIPFKHLPMDSTGDKEVRRGHARLRPPSHICVPRRADATHVRTGCQGCAGGCAGVAAVGAQH